MAELDELGTSFEELQEQNSRLLQQARFLLGNIVVCACFCVSLALTGFEVLSVFLAAVERERRREL